MSFPSPLKSDEVVQHHCQSTDFITVFSLQRLKHLVLLSLSLPSIPGGRVAKIGESDSSCIHTQPFLMLPYYITMVSLPKTRINAILLTKLWTLQISSVFLQYPYSVPGLSPGPSAA